MSTWGSVKIETNDTWNKCYRWYKVVSWLLAWVWSINFFMLFVKVPINIYVIICISIVCWYLSYKLGCLGGIAGNWVRHFTSPSNIRVRNPSAENMQWSGGGASADRTRAIRIPRKE